MTTKQHTAAGRILAALDTEERSQKWAADKAGIAYPTFRRKLAGGTDFTVSEVARIAAALNVHPIELLPQEFHTLAVAS